MPLVLLFTTFIVCYVLAFSLGKRVRHLMPKGRELVVGLVSVGIMIIFMTITYWFPSKNDDLYFSTGFGLSVGLASGLTYYSRKRE